MVWRLERLGYMAVNDVIKCCRASYAFAAPVQYLLSAIAHHNNCGAKSISQTHLQKIATRVYTFNFGAQTPTAPRQPHNTVAVMLHAANGAKSLKYVEAITTIRNAKLSRRIWFQLENGQNATKLPTVMWTTPRPSFVTSAKQISTCAGRNH